MSDERKVLYLLALIASIFALPYLGAYIQYGHNFPHTLFIYPAIEPLHKASFNPYIFGGCLVIFIGFVTFYLFPQWFGFKRGPLPEAPTITKTKLPQWFWIGLVLWIICLVLLWSKSTIITWYYKFINILLWWSFSIMIDGWVYQRSGGKSILATRPRELVGIGLASVMGWMIFEYLNFFVKYNWYYPIGHQIPSAEFLCYSMLASSAVFPISFEFYSLFNTFSKFRHKYLHGPKITLPKWMTYVLFTGSLAVLLFMSYYPDVLFFVIWLAPLIMLAILLDKLKIWTPFTPIKYGDWSPLLLIALSWVAAGLNVECWNYFSAYHENGEIITTNTFYWAYSIPYVYVGKIFEMPFLGYLGYLPYGVYAGIWWITFAYMANIPTQFSETGHRNV